METVNEQSKPVGRSRLPSQHQPEEQVGLQTLINLLEYAGKGKVTKVSFLPSKVKYDLEIPIMDKPGGLPYAYFRIANVDSAFVHPPFDNGFHYNSERDIAMRENSNITTDEPMSFTQKDLVSFGNFLLGKVRLLNDEGFVPDGVHDADLENWKNAKNTKAS